MRKRALRVSFITIILLVVACGFYAGGSRLSFSQMAGDYPIYDLSPDSPLIDAIYTKPDAAWAICDAIVACRITGIDMDVEGPAYNRPFVVRVDKVIAGNISDKEFRVYSDYKHILKPYVPRMCDRLILLVTLKNSDAMVQYRIENGLEDMPMYFCLPSFYITNDGNVIQVYQCNVFPALGITDRDELEGKMTAKWNADHLK